MNDEHRVFPRMNAFEIMLYTLVGILFAVLVVSLYEWVRPYV